MQAIGLSLLALGAVAAAPPLEAVSGESLTQAERRLRACLSANASGGHATLEAAVLSTRVACKPQIDGARDARIVAATAGLGPDEAQAIARRVTRELNNEIAHAIANFSGLSAHHAHH
ncbi:hypothetical protein GRI40_09180 [Altererythrobacter aerius]|uniref:UrcA family protein n=1 Tax=Tsuneonella aeria TaxID=1837929 RepID=A0A6I4TF83_9SPHN|nr:hypothetical protein [Tsuneonella aeria]